MLQMLQCSSFIKFLTKYGKYIYFQRAYAPNHIFMHEPLVVEAFYKYSGISKTILDIGANVGGYSMLSLSMGSKVYAVEMQPACCELLHCHANINEYKNLQIIQGFVPHFSQPQSSIRVNPNMCNVMSSSTATGGRWPHGLLMKSHRNMNWTATVPVRAVNLHKSLYTVSNITLTKIDTEGSEIESLLALDWNKLHAVIIEFQAGSWKYNNISRKYGIKVIKRFIDFRSYRIRTLFGKTSVVWSTMELVEFLKTQRNTFREFIFEV